MTTGKARKIWFVSYKTSDGSRHERLTRTFQAERDAKQFAMKMLKEDKYPVAGTLNPYQPKQIISSFRVAAWAAVE